MFTKLQRLVDQYNENNGDKGGKALLQRCETTIEKSDSEGECTQKAKRKKRDIQTPLILAIVTPLMARAHGHIQQASEIAFCDSTASLDRFNTSIFIISTATAMSGIPLAVLFTSDEREDTAYKAFELLKEVLPPCAFLGNGSSVGPQIFMIDDSISERLAIEKAWPSATILLCTFHFLQRRWTWLHDGKNGVTAHSDRLVLIKKLQNLVYASNEEFLTRYYNELHEKTPVSTKYPSFLQHIRSLWEKRHAWAHCYRTSMPIRGNNTNNYAEAGIKILKELVFSRVKAYNLVQMFSFVTEVMDIYYKKNILSLANNRVETYVALCLQGINAQKVARQDIKTTENGWYTVQSQTVRGEYYSVNTTIGFCTCLKGKDGSPCVHQAAVVIQCGEYGLNFSTSASSSARQKLAQIVLGDGAIQDAGFYSSLHQESLEGHSTCQNRNNISTDKPEFRGSQWDLIRAGASDGAENNETDCYLMWRKLVHLSTV